MTIDDADFMLLLKNYPETRQFSIKGKSEVSIGRHHQYLVTDGNMQYHRMIINDAGVALGSIRIKDNEVAIWIDMLWWKHGIATWVLQHHAESGMTAKIVEGNIASMRCFIRAGFLPIYRKEPETVVEQIIDSPYMTYNKVRTREVELPSYYIFKKA